MHQLSALLLREVAVESREWIVIDGVLGTSGDLQVFTGFTSAKILCNLSFADVLDESTGHGYQRRFSDKHSLDFRRYIQRPNATTIPLTFNLRPDKQKYWEVNRPQGTTAQIRVRTEHPKVLSQVDCQHRLGHLYDLDVQLPFMSYIGLDMQQEMKVFNTINSKARGLSSSLIDFHEATLSSNLAIEKPELYIALRLNNDGESTWHKQLDLGGKKTIGMYRRASLRTLQKAVKMFLARTSILEANPVHIAYEVVNNFWRAVAVVFSTQWDNPRDHLISKGIGVYALMSVLAALFKDTSRRGVEASQPFFASTLSDFLSEFDWNSRGPLRGLSGATGIDEASSILLRHFNLQSVPGGRNNS